MRLWTIQMARWRIAQGRGIPFIDATVKSGQKWLAPEWLMVVDYKGNKLSAEEYSYYFWLKMRLDQTECPERWDELVAMEEVAIACFCPADGFCHRYLLVDHLRHYCDQKDIPFTYLGELRA